MSSKYRNIFKPLRIGEHIIRNRFMATQGIKLKFLQGPEPYPSDAVINAYGEAAKNGAAIVICRPAEGLRDRSRIPMEDGRRMAMWDDKDPSVDNYLAAIADVIHFYGSKALVNYQEMNARGGYNISAIDRETVMSWKGMYMTPVGEEAPVAYLETMKQNITAEMVRYKKCGYDGCNLYMAYRSSLLACSFSPAVNKRTDLYGGSLENRSRLALELCREIKQACGKDFIVSVQMSAQEEEGGYTLEDTIGFCKLAEGLIDIIYLKGFDGNISHPTGYNSVKEAPVALEAAAAIKASGAKIITAPNGGYMDPELINKWIGEGKIDMAAMCRPFICDQDFMKKIIEDRGEDIVPCVRCNKCHVQSLDGQWVSVCSVNPRVGIRNRLDKMVDPQTSPKRVAVIGGGPAGMRAAIECRARGHEVVLFEKTACLGGQLRHADHAAFKWPLRDFKDWLIRQVYQQGVEVRLEQEPEPEAIKNEGFDAVISATGAVAKPIPVPGAESEGIWTPLDVFGREGELGHRVTVVGGSETGVETGLYLADCGHEVTLITRAGKLASNATPIHYYEMMEEYWQAKENFHYILQATTTAVSENSVTFTDKNGNTQTIHSDSVVVSGGMRPLQEEALRYYDCADRFFVVGDAQKPTNIHEANRSAFAAANLI